MRGHGHVLDEMQNLTYSNEPPRSKLRGINNREG
jgi:hypothetical protein